MCSMPAKDLSLSEYFTEGLRDGVTARRSDVKWAFGKKDAGLRDSLDRPHYANCSSNMAATTGQ